MEQTQTHPLPIGEPELKGFMDTLRRYKTGKARTEQRIISSENWWKLRNFRQDENLSPAQGFASRSGWLHNVIVSKHADAVESYPEPNILPREASDRPQAAMLSAIIPCILEQNRFEQTYSDVMWQKLKTGTGVYKIVWDKNKLFGMGDIGIERVDLLSIYWEPGITDIQKSRYFFHTQLQSKDLLRQRYPQLEGKLKAKTFLSAKFLYDDAVDDSDKATVIEVYYRKFTEGRQVLHYCKFVEDTVLYATENDPALAQRGLYDHGCYPYVFDTLFPIEGSPCGYGFVDICRNPQTEIDLLKTAFVKNARVGAVPRYFSRIDGNVNEEQFLDLDQALVQVSGNVDEATLRRIEHTSLDSSYLSLLDRTVDELRQTSGNTEASTGAVSSGVTAASAIAALQEAAGKGSRDSTLNSYRAYSTLVELCIELIRQFYTLPRQFRIVGNAGEDAFVTYTNAALQPQSQGQAYGVELGSRLPVFDIKVSAQKKNVYTKVSQNELALQFFKLGFFNPQLTQQALMCLEMMDFDGKDALRRQLTAMQAQAAASAAAQMAAMSGAGRGLAPAAGQTAAKLPQTDSLGNLKKEEHALVRRARAQARNTTQPQGTTAE